MRTVGRWLVAGWLLTALGVPGIDGRLPGFPAWTAPISLLALTLAALVHQQRVSSILDRPQRRNATGWRRRSSATGRGGGRGEQEAGFGLRQAPDD
jgi:hypothetical protein